MRKNKKAAQTHQAGQHECQQYAHLIQNLADSSLFYACLRIEEQSMSKPVVEISVEGQSLQEYREEISKALAKAERMTEEGFSAMQRRAAEEDEYEDSFYDFIWLFTCAVLAISALFWIVVFKDRPSDQGVEQAKARHEIRQVESSLAQSCK